MPWCDGCDRFWTVEAVATTGGECPSCRAPLPAPGSESHDRAPWHFKLLAAAVVVYLGWRAVQGVVWVVGRL
ncbi:MAG TPA: hypothetical protein VNT56_04075 [Acidimicrobiales bacterium]|jgi:hypothetical protein|nr:hypothetical protein [Acidimicrobiales bacterium]